MLLLQEFIVDFSFIEIWLLEHILVVVDWKETNLNSY